MDTPSLEQIAQRATIALKRLNPDFVSCVVHSGAPPVLAYRFRTKVSAELFAFGQQILGTLPYRHISNSDTTLVYEDR